MMELSPPPTESVKQWRCDQCSAIFGRLDHLKRHTLTHNADRTHVCHFCGSLFGRRDVLRRHWKSCKSRIESGHEIPDGNRGGKQKRACDSCASIRKACNGEVPCTECCDRGRVCTYERVPEKKDTLAAQIEAHNGLSQHNQDTMRQDEEISSWNMGLQNYYPAREVSQQVYARRNFDV